MKHILITGAAGNLGRAVTRKFLEYGHRVCALISNSRDADFMDHPMLTILEADLIQETEAESVIAKAAESISRVDMGILTVGGFGMGRLQETSLEDFEKMYRLNFVTAYNCARPLFKVMEKQETGGQIVMTGARPAMDPGAAKQMVAYSLTKSLLFSLAEVINTQGKENGITSSVIVPSIIDTPANRKAMPDADFTKWVTPEQIADNLHHLVTPAGLKLRETVMKVYGDA
jgi:NAD(P)-dependent dehydrogenase (short-subunit alcohol dehydrogenase family)